MMRHANLEEGARSRCGRSDRYHHLAVHRSGPNSVLAVGSYCGGLFDSAELCLFYFGDGRGNAVLKKKQVGAAL